MLCDVMWCSRNFVIVFSPSVNFLFYWLSDFNADFFPRIVLTVTCFDLRHYNAMLLIDRHESESVCWWTEAASPPTRTSRTPSKVWRRYVLVYFLPFLSNFDYHQSFIPSINGFWSVERFTFSSTICYLLPWLPSHKTIYFSSIYAPLYYRLFFLPHTVSLHSSACSYLRFLGADG